MTKHDGAQGYVIPSMRYRDAAKLIDWLCEAFGFERHMVVNGDDGSIAHAQLTLGQGMIMLGSARDDEYGAMVKPPEAGAPLTQAAYVVIPDADAHFARAKKAGAKIVRDLQDTPYGSREYAARDPEGQLWNFGTYDPWARGTTSNQT
jgi:uncharacterized glyoxalase superfamily protein PhnB